MLSPWDEMPYFDAPTFTKVALTQNVATRVALTNPQRVGIILCVPTATSAFFGPDSTVSGTKGIALTTAIANLYFDQHTWGALVQSEWWCFVGQPSLNCTVVEIVLRQWPSKGGKPDEPT